MKETREAEEAEEKLLIMKVRSGEITIVFIVAKEIFHFARFLCDLA